MPSLPGNNARNEGFQPSEGKDALPPREQRPERGLPALGGQDALPPKNSEGNPAHRRKGACW